MGVDAPGEEALALPAIDRGRLAVELLASLGPPVRAGEPTAHAAWMAELARRAQRALSGEELGELWADVEQRLRDELAG